MSDAWTADRLRAYILARLDEAGLADAEERLLTDDVFARELDVVETELIDDYVAGQLVGADLMAFEQAVAERPRLRDRVAFARALAARPHRASGSAIAPQHRWVALVATLALIAAGGWIVWRVATIALQAPISVEGPSPAPPSPDTGPTTTPESPPRQVQSTPPSPGQPAAPTVFAVLLPSGMTRGSAPELVRVPAGAARVLFRVPLAEGDIFAAYRLTLRDDADRIVGRAERLGAEPGRELQLAVDVSALPPQAELHVEGLDAAGAAVDLAFLPLDIRR